MREKITYIAKQIVQFVGVSILYRIPEPIRFDNMCFGIFRVWFCLNEMLIDHLQKNI